MCQFHLPREYKIKPSPWGPDDQIGRLNWITDESRARVMEAINPIKSYDISVDYFIGMPSWAGAGDPSFQIWMTHTPKGNVNDDLMPVSKESKQLIGYSGDAFTMYTHCGTHMDTLNHFGYGDQIWNGYSEAEDLGSRHWNKCGPENFPIICARAVLLDVAGALGVDRLPESYGIGQADLEKAIALQNVTIQQGDIVMIRTGQMTVWPDRELYLNNSPGLNIEGAQFLVGLGAMIIGADNIALEQTPSAEPDNYFPVHTYLFAEAGVTILEVLNLEELARDRVYEMAFIGRAMPIKGATGAPIQPVIFPLKHSLAA
ncbi:cyclase [Ignatzschineria sp. F8392]|uniref:cyclase family protein n=2 Tax=Ignatzschineria TaxID=112008 RepID=UPI000B97D746|nr:cyclase family protein [Ignatzschineria sp. F8392]OYQ81199.1 cyclase [Ignatzschineria sp. F8392]